jgi:hypothetical protein
MIYVSNIILALFLVFITGFNFKFKNKLEFLFLISLLIPIPILSFNRVFYLADIVLFIYLINYLTKKRKKQNWSMNIFFRRTRLKIFILLFLLPLFTTFLAFKNGDINNIGNVFLHFFRALMVIGVFYKGYQIGYTKSLNFIGKILEMYVFVWFFILVIGFLEFYNIIDTNVYNKDNSNFSGFFGMDKPQIALITVTVFNISLYLSFQKFNVLKYLVIILSSIILFLLGSRQGLVFLIISVILYLFITTFYRTNRLFKLRNVIFMVLLAFIAFKSQSFIGNNDKFQVVISSLNSENVIYSFLNSRDPMFIESFENVLNDNSNLIGNGIGTEESGYEINADETLSRDKYIDRTYFEGEIFRVFWVSGILGVAIYIIMYTILFIKAIKSLNNRLTYKERLIASILFSLVILNFLYSFGQFNIFTTDSQNIPFLYIIWFIFGILYSNLNKPKNLIK